MAAGDDASVPAGSVASSRAAASALPCRRISAARLRVLWMVSGCDCPRRSRRPTKMRSSSASASALIAAGVAGEAGEKEEAAAVTDAAPRGAGVIVAAAVQDPLVGEL